MVHDTIRVEAPLREVYDQWTQFEDFPRFMDGVEEVRQLDDRHCHWRTKVAGATREFDTEIVDQLPDERISWRTVGGDVRQKGVVTFERVDDSRTEVTLAMEFEPEGIAEKAAAAVGLIDSRVGSDLLRFKEFIEDRDRATGAWRGRLRPAEAADATEERGATAAADADATAEAAPPTTPSGTSPGDPPGPASRPMPVDPGHL
ncbi:SRPBCC family protein [Streptomyces sp. NPDC058664]|uniref:SRPBCC family protein n=1 Tax=unclassified Streptomyces TaxID=2593676 RepID=UPI00365787A1